jgi:hypothetical protein
VAPCFVGWVKFTLNVAEGLVEIVRKLEIEVPSICTLSWREENPMTGSVTLQHFPLAHDIMTTEGPVNLSCHIIGLSHVLSQCSFASCNLFIFKNFDLLSRVIESVFPPPQLPVWSYDLNRGRLSFITEEEIYGEQGKVWESDSWAL